MSQHLPKHIPKSSLIPSKQYASMPSPKMFLNTSQTCLLKLPKTIQTCSKHLPKTYPTPENIPTVSHAYSTSACLIFLILNSASTKETTPIGDLQTPGIEDQTQYAEIRIVGHISNLSLQIRV